MSSFAKQSLKGVTVYNLTFGKTADQWKEEQRAGHIHSLRYNEAFRTHVEFIQDAVFPTASTKVQISDDGMWMLAIGVYPPKLKMFDLSQLSMKFERGLESEAIDFCFLSEDWEKFVVLRDFRWMEFHTRHGRHYNMRMPVIGTCMCYNAPMCELYTGTIKNLVLRANLEQGRYFSPYETSLDYVNCCDVDSTHLLTAFGGLNGVIECWDPRNKTPVAKLDLYDSLPEIIPTPEVTKLKFGHDGLTMCAGLSSGHIGVYDLRRLKPLHVLNHRNKISIKDIAIHQQSSKIISCDSKTIRYWEQSSGELYTVITPAEAINGLCLVPNSGVIFVAQEQHRIGSYYVPSVGIAPKWCPFLDNMTEELEETKYRSIYIDYKFITRNELEALGLEHLIGTNLLKPYMHGFFIDIRLYRRVRAIVDPDAYEKFLKTKTEQNIQEKRSNRIEIKNKVPKINTKYANYLLSKTQQTQGKQEDKHEIMNAFVDPRFKAMFKEKDFTIDFENDSYLHMHPEIHYAMDQNEYREMVAKRNANSNSNLDSNGEDDDMAEDFVGDDEEDGESDGINDEQTFDDKFLNSNNKQIESQKYAKQIKLPRLIDELGSDVSDDQKYDDNDDYYSRQNGDNDDDNDNDNDDDDDDEDGWDAFEQSAPLRTLDVMQDDG